MTGNSEVGQEADLRSQIVPKSKWKVGRVKFFSDAHPWRFRSSCPNQRTTSEEGRCSPELQSPPTRSRLQPRSSLHLIYSWTTRSDARSTHSCSLACCWCQRPSATGSRRLPSGTSYAGVKPTNLLDAGTRRPGQPRLLHHPNQQERRWVSCAKRHGQGVAA